MLPSLPSNRFVNSIFLNPLTDEYFVSEEENDIISSFVKIKIMKEVARTDIELYVQEGNNYIYSFCTSARKLICGDRDTIANNLLVLLNTNQLNVHSKLLVSSFLGLYGSTLKLVEDSNKDFEQKGISQKLEQDIAFMNSSFNNNPEPDIIEVIYERYIKYKSVCQTIQVDDIAFIRDDIAYFNNYYIEARHIINKNSLESDRNNKLVSEIITVCTQKHMINLEKLTMNKEVYEFLLESEYVILDQHTIEQYLSEKVKENKLNSHESVLDIGINLDREIFMYDSLTTFTFNQSDKNEKALINSFLTIIATD